MTNHFRLFFALWPDEQTKKALTSIKIKGCKSVLADNLHVTLVFLGAVDQNTQSQLSSKAASIAADAFTVNFDQLSYWKKPKVLCLTSAKPAAKAVLLADSLANMAKACGLNPDPRPYVPHITLARKAKYLPMINIEPIAWYADTFCLVESHSEEQGVRYRVIQRWPLGIIQSG